MKKLGVGILLLLFDLSVLIFVLLLLVLLLVFVLILLNSLPILLSDFIFLNTEQNIDKFSSVENAVVNTVNDHIDNLIGELKALK